MSETQTVPALTYHVVRTRDEQGRSIVDLPVRERIEASFPPVTRFGHTKYQYHEALTAAVEIRDGRGYAIVVAEEDMVGYEHRWPTS